MGYPGKILGNESKSKKITFKIIFAKNYPENRINGVQRKVIQKTKLKKKSKVFYEQSFPQKTPKYCINGVPSKDIEKWFKKTSLEKPFRKKRSQKSDHG